MYYTSYISFSTRKILYSFTFFLLFFLFFIPSTAFAQSCTGGTPTGETAYLDNLEQGSGGTNNAGLAADLA